jgi:hypothetical protein
VSDLPIQAGRSTLVWLLLLDIWPGKSLLSILKAELIAMKSKILKFFFYLFYFYLIMSSEKKFG